MQKGIISCNLESRNQ